MSNNLIGWEAFSNLYGIDVFLVHYKIATEEESSFPQPLWDIKQAYDELMEIHQPDNVAFLATSAGVSITYQAIKKYSIPAGLIGFYGLTDLEIESDFSEGVNEGIDQYISAPYSRRHASPIQKPITHTDVWLVHGMEDDFVNVHQTQIMEPYHEVQYLQGKNHAFNVWDNCSDLIRSFVYRIS